jgi:hypothetical protein
MNFLILIIAFFTIIVLSKRFGIGSFMGAGFAGFFIYSIPAFINKSRHFFYLDSDFYLYEPSFDVMLVYFFAWAVFLLFVLLAPAKPYYRQFDISTGMPNFNMRPFNLRPFVNSGVFLSTTIILFAIFLPLQGNSATLILIIGRWIISMTFIAALIERRYIIALYIFCFLIFWFLGGDRTLLAITLMSSIVIIFHKIFKYSFIPTKKIFNFKIFLVLTVIILIIIFGKAIFVSITTGNSANLMHIFQSQQTLMAYLSKSFEPMIIFNHVQYVFDNPLNERLTDYLIGIFSNILIFPSYFGLSSNVYNEAITSSFPIVMSYGIAGNYYAHAYSMMGYFGVIIFALFYVSFLYYCDKKFFIKNTYSILFAMLGGLVAVYAHRNGFDNLLSFVRQILIAFFLIKITSILLRFNVKFK